MDYDIEKNFESHKMNEIQLEYSRLLRDQAKELANNINLGLAPSREKHFALTKLEECLMWANAAIAREEKEK